MLEKYQFHMITHNLIQGKLNIITKLFNMILDHPIKWIPVLTILTMILVNYIPGTNCGFIISLLSVQDFDS